MPRRRGLTSALRAVLVSGATALATALATAVAGPASPAVAAGPGGSSTSGGYTVEVSVVLSGDAAPGGPRRHVTRIRVRASCQWVPVNASYQDPTAMLAFYDSLAATPGYVTGQLGDRATWVSAASSSTPVGWYRANCVNPDLYDGFTQGSFGFNGAPLPVTYAAFPVGAGGPPAPRVDPRDLAEAAYRVMVLPLPQVERNPRATATGGGTLVGLPTWFWVTDPASVGGAAGTRTVRAEVNGGAVWAQVNASTDGLVLASPAVTTTCPPSRAMVAWRAGLADTAGCTVSFPRASVAYSGGYPVTATATWRANWAGSGGSGGGLAAVTRQTTTQVPVAEAQSLVGAKG